MNTLQYRYGTRQSGFTLLLAALVASIALTLGSALFSFATKQIALSSINKNSQFAFFNADSAAECALYWDNKGSESLPYPFFSQATPSTNPPNEITCEGQAVPVFYADTSGGSPLQSSTFTFKYSPNNTPPQSQGSCAEVIVTKTKVLRDDGVSEDTSIQARGWSTSCATLNTSKTVLERAAQISY